MSAEILLPAFRIAKPPNRNLITPFKEIPRRNDPVASVIAVSADNDDRSTAAHLPRGVGNGAASVFHKDQHR
jgi:hypothetical protein